MRRCGRILGRMRLVAAVLVPLCVASSGWAQGSRKDDVVFGPQGRPAAGATITVCAASATGSPCSPLASLYTDATLTVSSPNPFTTDGLGNYHFYAAPGRYQVQVSGPGITTYTLSDVILPSDPSSMASGNNVSAFGLTLGGNLSVAGNASVTGTLSAGAFSPSSLAVPGNASFAGPRPAVYVTAPPYNAKGDGVTDDTVAVQAAVTTACSNTAAGGGTLFFPPSLGGGYYRLTQTQTSPAGETALGLGTNRVAQVTIPAGTLSRVSNGVTFTPGGSPFNVSGGPGTWYAGEGVTIAGATDTSFNGTWPILSASASSITFYQSGATLSNATSGGGTATTNSPVLDLSLCAKNGTAVAFDTGNSYGGTQLQFSQAPQTRILVQSLGASPNTAPVFLVTGAGWSLKNLTVVGYNQALQVNNTVEYISDNVGYVTQCSGQTLGGVTDNVPLAVYSTFWVKVTGGTMNVAASCANSLYGVIWANVNNQQVSGIQTFRDMRMAGAMLFDERGSGLGSCCAMDLENINLEGVNNLPAFAYTQTGSSGHSQFGSVYMNQVDSFDCTNGKGVFQNNTGTTIQGLTVINSNGCGAPAGQQFTVENTSTGKFVNCRIMGNFGGAPLAVDASFNPIAGCVVDHEWGELLIPDTTDTGRLRTDVTQNGLDKPPIALAPPGSGKQVTVALDPGTSAGAGGLLMNDGSQSGFNTQIYSNAPNTLNVAMAAALPPTNVALATVNNGSGGCGTSNLASGTYYYNVNARSSGAQSGPAGEQSIAVNGTQCVNVTWTASGGTSVTDYLVARATCVGCTTSGGGAKQYTSASSPFLDSGSATSSGNNSPYNASLAAVSAWINRKFGVNNAAPSAQLDVITQDASTIGFSVKAAASPAQNLWQVLNSTGVVQAKIDSGFNFSTTGHHNQAAANGDTAGQISISSATSGSKTFGAAYSSAPACTASPTSNPGSVVWWVTSSTTSVTVNLSASSTITFNYVCVGNPN